MLRRRNSFSRAELAKYSKLDADRRKSAYRALVPHIVKAGPVARALIKRLGLIAITMPWGKVYVLPDWLDDESLWTHEAAHLSQLERHGAVWFTLRYLGLLNRYGYASHPMEREALERQHYGYTSADVAGGLKIKHRIPN